MTQEIHDLVPASDLVALGEPTHREPAFGVVRNHLFARLVERGFRSIALETDRVAALAVQAYVTHGAGSLDAAMTTGFTHGFGELAANRRLVTWIHHHNASRPAEDHVHFYGFDVPTEMMSYPSPRTCLEYVRDYLGARVELTGLLGDDDRWGRTEAVLDPRASIGATADAHALHSIADDLLTSLHARAPELVATTSLTRWRAAKVHATAALDLLRMHRQAAKPADPSLRLEGLSAVRDAIMARHLVDIRTLEARRGPTLVFAHNRHLQRHPSTWTTEDAAMRWSGAGAIVTTVWDGGYTFVPGSLGSSSEVGLVEPAPHTFEGRLRSATTPWSLTKPTNLDGADVRTDTTPDYFPLDQQTVDAADALLHISDGAAAVAEVGA
ncbi:erythromycin esterase family protein [Spiractinospora alimapuensis]|uniref:erythromycin esterase family protein n=1 Tax=Spiractinospora alimapuensis TaxID=2820884 RepID=UPI001F33CD88|nr:erythromycin esterase family protein [Spiractinospora alimapuensis]QVQ51545.1 erythromycin esterase family protein [Spiractinospora alimapuensis]